jgi:hypothetical protein
VPRSTERGERGEIEVRNSKYSFKGSEDDKITWV